MYAGLRIVMLALRFKLNWKINWKLKASSPLSDLKKEYGIVQEKYSQTKQTGNTAEFTMGFDVQILAG